MKAYALSIWIALFCFYYCNALNEYRYENARGTIQSEQPFSDYKEGWSKHHRFSHQVFQDFVAPFADTTDTVDTAAYTANLRKRNSHTDIHDMTVDVVCRNQDPPTCVCVASLMNQECTSCEACHTGQFAATCGNVVDKCSFTNGGLLGDTATTCDGSTPVHATACYESSPSLGDGLHVKTDDDSSRGSRSAASGALLIGAIGMLSV